MPKEVQLSLINRVSEGLQQKPAYLLIFGVAALFVLSGLASSATAIVRGEIGFAVVALVSFIVALGAAVLVVRQVEGLPIRAREASYSSLPEPLSDGEVQIIDERLDRQVRSIRGDVQRAANHRVLILTEEVANELNEIVLQAQAWGRGELHSDVGRYRKVLLELYERAQRSIFSTTNREYLANWLDELMDKMIEASERANADHVTRVFIFDNHSDVDPHAIAVLRRFAASDKIKTFVYFNDEDEGFNFPPDVSKDFVVIDEGEAIGVTLSYDPGNQRAQWYFGDENRKQRFQKICADLRRGCDTADKVLTWWDKREDAGD